ncbi:hypothetical protein [Mycetocola sp.]|uniref:hypothetical protein n=1 Tax=Mycetocola sp. TaxID=1871042 RepID=UPI003988B4EF
MSDSRDIEDQLKINDADGEVRRADRTEAGVNTGSTSADATGDNRSVLDDVAHPFDQTNGILDAYDETHPGNVTGESPSEYAASAGPAGRDAPSTGGDDSYMDDDDTRVVPPPLPPARP